MNLTYKEYTPILSLKPFVQCYWHLQSNGKAHDLSPIQSCFPSGMIEWIIQLRGKPCMGFSEHRSFTYPQSYFSGISDKATPYAVYGQTEMFGVRLFPEAAMELLGMNLKPFRNNYLDADLLKDIDFNTLHESLIAASTQADQISLVEAFLSKRLHDNFKTSYLFRALRLLRSENAPDIKGLSKLLFVGERQLQRSFKESVGISPKSYFRLVRLFKAHSIGLKRMNSYAEVAYRVGYSDPSHFSRDFKDYFGKTPAAHFTSASIQQVA